MNVEVRTTEDGSSTLYVPALDEHYHSTHGAIQEAMHVYLGAALEPAMAKGESPVRILEIGFGTGLNALLTLQRSLTATVAIAYDTIEKYPLTPDVISSLQAERYLLNPELLGLYEQLHTAAWDEAVPLLPRFLLRKVTGALQETHLASHRYDVIYFDAFAPDKQPDMWTDEVFAQLYEAAAPGCLLTSYCAKGSFRRSLKAAGWLIEKLPGPAGKREMTRASKR